MKSALRFHAPLDYLAAAALTAFVCLAFLAFFAFLVVGAAAAAGAADGDVAGAAECAAAKAESENRPATRAAISFFIFNLSIRQLG